MNMDVDMKIVSRISKLLALATNKAATVEEAATALGMAQELLFKHKLEMAQVEIDTGEKEEVGGVDFDEDGPYLARWKDVVLAGLCHGCYCKGVNMSSVAKNAAGEKVARVTVFGKPSDTQTVAYLYGYVCNEIRRLLEEQGKGRGTAFRNSFRIGAATAIQNRMAEKRKEQDKATASNEKALALIRNDDKAIDRYIKDNVGRVGKSARTVVADVEGYRAGTKAGQGIHLDGGGRGLNAERRQKLLGS